MKEMYWGEFIIVWYSYSLYKTKLVLETDLAVLLLTITLLCPSSRSSTGLPCYPLLHYTEREYQTPSSLLPYLLFLTKSYHQSTQHIQHTLHNPSLHHPYMNILLLLLPRHSTCDYDTILDKLPFHFWYQRYDHQ
jgi:hypothetical protein